MHDKYLGLGVGEFTALTNRYLAFQDTCDVPEKAPVKVFSPLSEKSLAELYLIREVSKDLEKKKQEDMQKAAQNAEETEGKPEEKTEENKPQTEK